MRRMQRACGACALRMRRMPHKTLVKKRSSDPAGCIERDGGGEIGEGIGGIQSQNGSESLEVAVAPGRNDS
jgi:hypothetical protein